MANLTVSSITSLGLTPVLVAADVLGDTFSQPVANVFLFVKNGDIAAKQVTVTAETVDKEVSGWGTLKATDIVVSVPAGETKLIGPFPKGPYSMNPQIAYDAVTSVTVAAIRLPG